MKIKINNEYKCFMSIPNINYWYDDEGRKIFIGWLWWGIDIVFKGYIVRHSRMYSWIRSADVPDGSRDTFRYRTAIVDEEDNGNKIFVVPGAKYVPNDKLWWRDLTPPECAKHYNEGN